MYQKEVKRAYELCKGDIFKIAGIPHKIVDPPMINCEGHIIVQIECITKKNQTSRLILHPKIYMNVWTWVS